MSWDAVLETVVEVAKSLFSWLFECFFGHFFAESEEAKLDRVFHSGLYVKFIEDDNEYTGKAIAISSKQALSAFHGHLSVGHGVTLITHKGVPLQGTVTFVRYAQELMDIAVITLDGDSKFRNYTPVAVDTVRILQELYVVRLEADAIGNGFSIAANICHVRKVNLYLFISSDV